MTSFQNNPRTTFMHGNNFGGHASSTSLVQRIGEREGESTSLLHRVSERRADSPLAQHSKTRSRSPSDMSRSDDDDDDLASTPRNDSEDGLPDDHVQVNKLSGEELQAEESFQTVLSESSGNATLVQKSPEPLERTDPMPSSEDIPGLSFFSPHSIAELFRPPSTQESSSTKLRDALRAAVVQNAKLRKDAHPERPIDLTGIEDKVESVVTDEVGMSFLQMLQTAKPDLQKASESKNGLEQEAEDLINDILNEEISKSLPGSQPPTGNRRHASPSVSNASQSRVPITPTASSRRDSRRSRSPRTDKLYSMDSEPDLSYSRHVHSSRPAPDNRFGSPPRTYRSPDRYRSPNKYRSPDRSRDYRREPDRRRSGERWRSPDRRYHSHKQHTPDVPSARSKVPPSAPRALRRLHEDAASPTNSHMHSPHTSRQRESRSASIRAYSPESTRNWDNNPKNGSRNSSTHASSRRSSRGPIRHEQNHAMDVTDTRIQDSNGNLDDQPMEGVEILAGPPAVQNSYSNVVNRNYVAVTAVDPGQSSLPQASEACQETSTQLDISPVPGVWAYRQFQETTDVWECKFTVGKSVAATWNIYDPDVPPNTRPLLTPHQLHLNLFCIPVDKLGELVGAASVSDFPIQWPLKGQLLIEVNQGTDVQRMFIPDDKIPAPLDITNAIQQGTNTLRFVQLEGMRSVFVLYATSSHVPVLDFPLSLQDHRLGTSA